jgi:hypothetical protein
VTENQILTSLHNLILQLRGLQAHQVNALELQIKVQDVKRGQLIQMEDVIYIKNLIKQKNMNMLFAIDAKTEEAIVSNSPKGSNKIKFIERIKRQDNTNLYTAIELLTSISNASSFDTSIFSAMDKVCQMMYNKHKEMK